jgi:hypothetical protein
MLRWSRLSTELGIRVIHSKASVGKDPTALGIEVPPMISTQVDELRWRSSAKTGEEKMQTGPSWERTRLIFRSGALACLALLLFAFNLRAEDAPKDIGKTRTGQWAYAEPQVWKETGPNACTQRYVCKPAPIDADVTTKFVNTKRFKVVGPAARDEKGRCWGNKLREPDDHKCKGCEAGMDTLLNRDCQYHLEKN